MTELPERDVVMDGAESAELQLEGSTLEPVTEEGSGFEDEELELPDISAEQAFDREEAENDEAIDRYRSLSDSGDTVEEMLAGGADFDELERSGLI